MPAMSTQNLNEDPQNTITVTETTISATTKELVLSDDDMRQLAKLESAEDKGAFIEALMNDDQASVTVLNEEEVTGVTHVHEPDSEEPTPVARTAFTDEMEARRKGAMPRKDYQVRFAEINDEGIPVKTNETVNATSYADAVSTVFQDAIEQGRVIDRVFPGHGEEPPALIQLDRNVYDLTASADNDTTFHVGAIGLRIARQGQDLSVVLSDKMTGEELDSVSISDADYKALLDPDESQDLGGPKLG
jgi:hypothetical protein